MRVCAEFSGSAGEAPTGIKVAVEAVEEVTWELAFILGGGQTHPPTPVGHLRGKATPPTLLLSSAI